MPCTSDKFDKRKRFTADDANFSEHPDETWTFTDIDTSGDPWDLSDMEAIDGLGVGSTLYVKSHDLIVKRLA